MINPFFDGQRRWRNGWWMLFFFLVLGAMLVPATIAASARGLELDPGAQGLLAALATAVCLALRREHPSTVLGNRSSWLRGVPIGLLLGSAIWLLTAFLLWATGAVSWAWSSAASVATGALACLGVAVVEELVFRGFVFQRLIAGIGAWPAQILMAAYFLLTHAKGVAGAGDLQGLAMFNIFLAGLMFGQAWLRTRSLALPIALHFALNFVQGPILGFGISGNAETGWLRPVYSGAPDWWTGGIFGLEASVPGTALIALTFLALLLWRRRSEPTQTAVSRPAQ